ncbi:STAS domain-containing protein [Kitasatospora sp. NPDC058406]|uniref:STAS domain-containing protein n=1 Tax=Kitasatospora sp. NPDC058406 TaxID=3346483 RepID=UPI003658BAA4
MNTSKPLYVRVIASTESVLVRLAGELDLDSAPLVDRAVDSCLGHGVRRVTVDLAAVTFCDSHGLMALERSGRIASACGVTFRLSGIHRRLWSILSLYREGSLPGVGVPSLVRPEARAYR